MFTEGHNSAIIFALKLQKEFRSNYGDLSAKKSIRLEENFIRSSVEYFITLKMCKYDTSAPNNTHCSEIDKSINPTKKYKLSKIWN